MRTKIEVARTRVRGIATRVPRALERLISVRSLAATATFAGSLFLIAVVLGATAQAQDKARTRAEQAAWKELEDQLDAQRPETRRAAVKKIAEQGGEAALELLVRALGDRDGSVADEAQVALIASSDPRSVVWLAGRNGLGSREPWVRRRAAEALGRVPHPIPTDALLDAVALNQPELSLALLTAVERQALAQRAQGESATLVKALERWLRRGPPVELRAAALCALDDVDASAAETWRAQALVAGEPALRIAALARPRGLNEMEIVKMAVLSLGDDEGAVRCQAIETLESLGTRGAFTALVDHMEREPRPRLRWRILAHLQRSSGLTHGFDVDAWRAWASTVRGAVSTGDAHGAPRIDTRAKLAGLDLVSDRACFLIDFSGSMWEGAVAGKTRKQIVGERLRDALQALPTGSEFNLIPYTAKPFPWQERMVRADKASVEAALRWFEKLDVRGRGDFYGAVQAALRDPRVDTLVTLTDGVPTGGVRWNLDLMFDLLVEETRWRKVAFDSILVDAPRSKHRQWVELARRTGGQSITLDLAALAKAGDPRAGKAGERDARARERSWK